MILAPRAHPRKEMEVEKRTREIHSTFDTEYWLIRYNLQGRAAFWQDFLWRISNASENITIVVRGGIFQFTLETHIVVGLLGFAAPESSLAVKAAVELVEAQTFVEAFV